MRRHEELDRTEREVAPYTLRFQGDFGYHRAKGGCGGMLVAKKAIALLLILVGVGVVALWLTSSRMMDGDSNEGFTIANFQTLEHGLRRLSAEQLDGIQTIDDLAAAVQWEYRSLRDGWGDSYAFERSEEGNERVITVRCTHEIKRVEGPLALTVRYVAGDKENLPQVRRLWTSRRRGLPGG